jgi:hypothetical protein
MKFSPMLLFWLQFAAMVGTGVTGGAVHLTGLVPPELFPYVTGWVSFVTFVVMTFLTIATGGVGAGTGLLARAPTVGEAQLVMKQAQDAVK